MKRGIVFGVYTLLFILFFTNGMAQHGINIHKGIKGGIGIAKIHSDDPGLQDVSTRNGVVAGVFMRVSLMNLIPFQPELFFAEKGAKIKGGTENIVLKFQYLELPLLLKVNLPGGIILPTIFAGPSFAINLGARLEENGQETDISDNLKNSDVGFVVGGGLNIGPLEFDVHYTFSLSSIDDSGENVDIKNRVLSIMAGLSF